MVVQNFSYNPFSLTNAQSAWNDQSEACLLRGANAFAEEVYDIYVKNPYDLTINNVKALIKSPSPVTYKDKDSSSCYSSFWVTLHFDALWHFVSFARKGSFRAGN